jgi:hypothetical protein
MGPCVLWSLSPISAFARARGDFFHNILAPIVHYGSLCLWLLHLLFRFCLLSTGLPPRYSTIVHPTYYYTLVCHSRLRHLALPCPYINLITYPPIVHYGDMYYLALCAFASSCSSPYFANLSPPPSAYTIVFSNAPYSPLWQSINLFLYTAIVHYGDMYPTMLLD